MQAYLPFSLFYIDALAEWMLGFVLLLGGAIFLFARRYLLGDARYPTFLAMLNLTVGSIALFICADHLLLFLAGWIASSALFTLLITHKPSWQAAKASGYLALKAFSLSFLCLAFSFSLFYMAFRTLSIQEILHAPITHPWLVRLAILGLFISAFIQCGIWPFHRWLVSSFNAPTPVSALMHAGLVNGGGFLLVRFSPLFASDSYMLGILFFVGILAALMGNSLQRRQPSIKGELACSTMGQMGFMLLQCSLGLFAGAIAHLCWHGFFKSYLFLTSAESVGYRKKASIANPSLYRLFSALLAGALGAWAYRGALGLPLSWGEASILFTFVVFIFLSQVSLHILRASSTLAATCLVSMVVGATYGVTTGFVESKIGLSEVISMELKSWHLVGGATLFLIWLASLYPHHLRSIPAFDKLYLRAYFFFVSSGLPAQQTWTPFRSSYEYAQNASSSKGMRKNEKSNNLEYYENVKRVG